MNFLSISSLSNVCLLLVILNETGGIFCYRAESFIYVGFEVLTAVVMDSSIFWDITHCLLPNSRWFLASLILRPWRWWRYVPPKRCLSFNGLYGIIRRTDGDCGGYYPLVDYQTTPHSILENSLKKDLLINMSSVSGSFYFGLYCTELRAIHSKKARKASSTDPCW
jgi:hypothetical protein